MSGSTSNPLSPTVAAYPTTTDAALAVLALMGAQSGVLSDYNPGSIVRTQAESLGSVLELQGIAEQTTTFQTMVYGALTALGITPLAAQAATGLINLSTPGPTSQAILIPGGTLLQTAGGIQFQTLSGAIIASGQSSIQTAIQAVSGGTSSNVASGTITQLLTSIAYPVSVSNPIATAGGANAESLATTLARFAAATAAPGLASPYAVANAAIGLSYGTETVKAAEVYEPFAAAGAGNPVSGQAGFTLYIDDGTGTASAGLLSVVASAISSGSAAQGAGFRPAGVPYQVAAVTPTYAVIAVTGSLLPGYGSATGVVVQNISGALATYGASLTIGQVLYQGSLAGVVGDAGQGQLSAFSVTLSGGPGGGLTSLSPPYSGRVIVSSIAVAFSGM